MIRAGKLCGRGRGGFALLEVLISLMILGISIATLMRSFTVSLRAISKNEVITRACGLAEGLVQDFELNPPTSKSSRGDFVEQGFPNYSWTADYEEEEIRYKNLKTKNKIRESDLKPLKHLTVKVTYDDGKHPAFSPVELDLYLPPIERFSFQSKWLNELFKEEETNQRHH